MGIRFGGLGFRLSYLHTHVRAIISPAFKDCAVFLVARKVLCLGRQARSAFGGGLRLS